MALNLPTVRREHRIDYLGAATIVAAVSALLLYLDWAGGAYGWTAPESLALAATAAVLTVLFVAIERRAAEPIIPLRLFANPIFSVGNLFGFCAGVVMFGTIIFLPLFLQAVMGMSPTRSGLAMVPAVVGIFFTSIGSGQLITRTGRYKIFPILGAAVLIVALGLMSRLEVTTPFWRLAVYEFLFGAGLGFTMQTIVVAVQNAVPYRDMGAATSATTFFRQMGGTVGAAIFGAVLANRLARYLAERLGDAPATAAAGGAIDANNIEAIQALPEPVRLLVQEAFTGALTDVSLFGVPFAVGALVVALFLKEVPLRTGRAPAAEGTPAEPVAAPPGQATRGLPVGLRSGAARRRWLSPARGPWPGGGRGRRRSPCWAGGGRGDVRAGPGRGRGRRAGTGAPTPGQGAARSGRSRAFAGRDGPTVGGDGGGWATAGRDGENGAMGTTRGAAAGTAGDGSAIGWAFRAVAALTVGLVLVQAALAGRGLYVDLGVISLHGWVGNVTFVAAIALVAVGFGGRRRGVVGRIEAGLSLLLLALIVAQLGLGYVGRERAGAAAWHIPNGVLTFGVAAAILALAAAPAGRRPGADPAVERGGRTTRPAR